MDANYDVIALVDGDSNSPTYGDVLVQYSWTPYGELAAVDVLTANPPTNRIGHQGLFFERFYVEPGSTVLDPALTPTAAGLYYNRNRWYSPQLGRFTSLDPIESAMPIITALVSNGGSWDILLGGLEPQSHFTDGMNLYVYLGDNPLSRLDALGLSWGYEDEIDDSIADRTGQALYSLATLNEGARWASIGLNTAVNIAAGFLPGSGLYEAFNSVQVLASGRGGFWDAMNIAMAAFPLMKAGKAVLGLRSMGRARMWGLAACNCFVAGTLVCTPDGDMPIESVLPGDIVLTQPEICPECTPEPGEVTRVFVNIAPTTLWIALEDGTVLGTTPGHRVWTQQAGWVYAANVAVGDTFRNTGGEPVAVTQVVIDANPSVVYNLEVDGTFTYLRRRRVGAQQ